MQAKKKVYCIELHFVNACVWPMDNLEHGIIPQLDDSNEKKKKSGNIARHGSAFPCTTNTNVCAMSTNQIIPATLVLERH